MNTAQEWHLSTSHVGKRTLLFEQLDSTNTFALALANDPAHDGLVIIANEQTAGRGQHGRTWSCPGGAGVLMSVLLFPPAHLRRPAILTAWAAVSVSETLFNLTGLQATIKWPNDVLVQGRKVCGILSEQKHGTVVGIGLNVNHPAEFFADAGLPQAASLATLTSRQWSCHDVARQLIAELDAQYQGRMLQGDLAGLEKSWQRRLGLVGQLVELETATGPLQGKLQHITFEELELLSTDGQCVRLPPERVRQLRLAHPQITHPPT